MGPRSKQKCREKKKYKKNILNDSLNCLKCISSLENLYKSDQRVSKETTIDLMHIFLKIIHHFSQKMSGNRTRQITVTETEISHG